MAESHTSTEPPTAPSDQPPVVVVTRVGSCIGAEAAVHFLKRGATVIGIGSYPDRVSKLQAALAKLTHNAGKFIPCIGSATSHDIQNEVMDLIKREGRFTALVNNVGAYEPHESSVVEPIEQWEMLQRSLLETLPMIHRLRGLMRRSHCRVVNVASDDSTLSGLAPNVALVAIKTAVNMFTAEIALVEPGVTSLAVHPGVHLPFASSSSSSSRLASDIDQLQPAGELIASLALTADHAMSGQFFMYSEPEFLKS